MFLVPYIAEQIEVKKGEGREGKEKGKFIPCSIYNTLQFPLFVGYATAVSLYEQLTPSVALSLQHRNYPANGRAVR